MGEERFKKTRIKEKGKGRGIHQPFHSIWVADFMLRQDARKFTLGKYLSDRQIQQIPKKRRRRLGMAVAVAGITRTASFLTKISKIQSAGCRLCRIA